MDITPVFKACVRTLRTRNKTLGITEKDTLGLDVTRSKTKSDFSLRTKEVIITITKMRDFLLEHRKDYITVNHILHGIPVMTDAERDKIDNEAQKFMQMCVEVLKALKSEVKHTFSAQLKEHQEAVVFLIDHYLKAVCKIYSGQKAIRVKQAIDRQKMLRLETDFKKKNISHTVGSSEKEETRDPPALSSPPDPEVKENQSERRLPESQAEFLDSNYSSTDAAETQLSAEELQLFEEENQKLYEDMNTLVDEVRQIEGKVVEIGKLQEILSEKVLQQDQDITRISDTVINTTENIKEGNEEIREALRKNASLRVWILFILIVLSFSLLFLDWYSP